MEVLVGPTFAIEVPSSPPHAPPMAYDGDRTGSGGDNGEREVPKSFFEDGSRFRVGGRSGFLAGDSSGSSSSIGTPDDSDVENDDVSSKKENEGEEEEVQSKLKGLNSLDSLEDSLPIKRGLSNHFIGKSKSFTDLSKVSSLKDLQKQENPFNKRRRVLIASKWSKRSSFYTWSNPKSMPLLPLDEESDAEEEEKEEGEEEEEGKGREVSLSPSSSPSSAEEKKPQDHEVLLRQQNRVPLSYAAHMRRRLGSFKSRSLSLADLQEHDDDEDDDDDD